MNHTIKNLERDTKGMFIESGDARLSFSGELVRVLGEEDALRWFYETEVPVFDDMTPRAYSLMVEDGKRNIANEFYKLITGQPD